MPRVLAIWLDGFDMRLATRLGLPTLAKLANTSTHAILDNGIAHLTGLTGEHLATGLDPDRSGRAAAVEFDTENYTGRHQGALHPPVYGGVPTVVLDPCYFDITGTTNVSGTTDWGAHDPGGPRTEMPVGLYDEIVEIFGAYPARPWVYATPWASAERCQQMGTDLTTAVETRSAIAQWLLGERLPDWDLAFVGVSEAHSASEGLFHGADPDHPLADLPSSPVAGEAIASVYGAVDQLVADLIAAFPDAIHVVFAPHGMGPNASDLPSMLLLGELMARWNGLDTPAVSWPTLRDGVPLLKANESWSGAVLSALEGRPSLRARVASRLRRNPRIAGFIAAAPPARGALSWMPLMRHQPNWHSMRAFAVPSFYDGRVRVNLIGREAHGIVGADEYNDVLDQIEETLRGCSDTRTGDPVVARIERPFSDPYQAGSCDSDLIVHWAGMPLGFEHHDLGVIGPFPPRRTGSHASPFGACFVHGSSIPPDDLGTRSSFDVVPTLLLLAECPAPWEMSGTPMPISVST